MRPHAYVLAGDPAWARSSVSAYYDFVDKIVVSYDASGRSWAGHELAVQEALTSLKAVDHAGKLVMLPGDWCDPSRPRLTMETLQRQAALDAASPGADWVLQLDTDEIMLAPDRFFEHLREADKRGAGAMHFPMRGFYQRLDRSRFLEYSSRHWRPVANYPGPLAVRAGTELRHCRQTDSSLYRVDFRPWNTDPHHPRAAAVHALVDPAEAVAHLSLVRSRDEMVRKSQTDGHAAARDWDEELRRWTRRGSHPYRTVLATPLHDDPGGWFRIGRLPPSALIEG